MEEDTTTKTDKTYALARQLRCPKGEEVQLLGEAMNRSNGSIIASAIDALNLKYKNRILEIGPGNGAHLKDILGREENLRYFGLEISETMRQEASRLNQEFVKQNRALFRCYNGDEIPYVGPFFDRILSVNALYFWKRPEVFLQELHRVLKPGGYCVLAFANSDFMKTLPFVDDSFALYDLKKLELLVNLTEFGIHHLQIKKEQVESKSGKQVERDYTIVTLKKRMRVERNE